MFPFEKQMPYTDGEKRYHTLAYDLCRRFGGRVWKAAVDAGDMLETARLIGRIQPDGVKIHALQVIEGTRIADWWRRGEVPLLTKEAYVDIVCRQLEWIAPATVIERLTGDGPKSRLLAPDWRCGKIAVLAGIDCILRERDTWQGKCLMAKSPT